MTITRGIVLAWLLCQMQALAGVTVEDFNSNAWQSAVGLGDSTAGPPAWA